MQGFILKISEGTAIRFKFYADDAPATCAAFIKQLPFTRTFMHARVSGQEIWIDDAPPVDVIQENASVFTQPGEVVYGPLSAKRTKTINCMGIYYGEGRGLDCCNIFARVFEDDAAALATLGNDIWKNGIQSLTFELMK